MVIVVDGGEWERSVEGGAWCAALRRTGRAPTVRARWRTLGAMRGGRRVTVVGGGSRKVSVERGEGCALRPRTGRVPTVRVPRRAGSARWK